MTTPKLRTLETMNGYAVIAERSGEGHDRLILAVRRDEYSASGFEYVTAWTQSRDENPTSWYWGHYMNDIDEALTDLRERWTWSE